MKWITADQSQIRFQSCSYANNVAIPRTSYYTAVLPLYSEWNHENNQSTHIYIYEPHNNSKTADAAPTINILEAKNKKSLKLSHGPKHRSWRAFFTSFVLYTFFWLNVNSYTWFWQFTFIMVCTWKESVRIINVCFL